MADQFPLIPQRDVIVVQYTKGDSKSSGGIWTVDSESALVKEAVIVAVGPGIMTQMGELIPTGLDVGDIVVVQTQSPHQKIREAGVEYLLYHAHDVLLKRARS